jgi:RNA polymerase sigma factor (sigma-70 family)
VINEARRARPRSVPLAEPAVVVSEPAEAVREALRALPERQRLALFLRYYADLDYAAIAAALGVARGTVSATLHAAHANLQTHLEEVIR